ncbi:tetratricopeptide repeat protein [Thermococcus sp.]|uniref:tetratricopeptide repeat protein n=1 Tax=Thermococcus sp. TaxID=35749 RepID=UPI00261DBE5D|nr:tetratricopeptide repeat protein [Thermococcus sp.]
MKGVEKVAERLRVGDYRGSLREALTVEDPLRKLVALLRVLEEFPREEVLYHMLETLDGIGDTPGKALGLSIVGRGLYSLDREIDAENYFERAIQLARRIRSPKLRGEVLGGIARNLARSDRYTDAYLLFCEAVETLNSSRGFSSGVISSLLKLARLIERSADETGSDVALNLYRLARDVYESAHFQLQARYLEEKITLIEDLRKRGRRVIDELIEKGEASRAVGLMRFLEPEERALELLKLAYWLFLHGREGLAKEVLGDALDLMLVGKFTPKDAEIAGIVHSLLRIGRLEEPLILAGLVRDRKLTSELLGEIAVAYARVGDEGRARAIAEGISDESIKNRVLKALQGGEGVEHEQGLPLTGGGEGDRALPEDDRRGKVQGTLGQEEDDSAGEGDAP